MEEFRDLSSFGYPDYWASVYGYVYSSKRGWRKMKLHPNAKGYYRVHITDKNGVCKGVFVASLICKAFHGERPEGYQCDHIDGNKQNNHKDNLHWVTPKDNMHNPVTHKRMVEAHMGESNSFYGKHHSDDSKELISQKNSKRVRQRNLDGSVVREWKSQKEASDVLKISYTGLNHCLKGVTKSCGNFLWEYV